MEMIKVASSNISSIGYDADNMYLNVEFNNGKTFAYADVTPAEALDLEQAQSVGRHFNQYIRAAKVATEVVAMSQQEKIDLLREAGNLLASAIAKHSYSPNGKSFSVSLLDIEGECELMDSALSATAKG